MQDNRINNILDYNGHRFTHTKTESGTFLSKVRVSSKVDEKRKQTGCTVHQVIDDCYTDSMALY